MSKREVKIDGLEELVKTLRALPSELSSSSRGGILALALRDQANLVKKHIQANAPVGEGQKYITNYGQKVEVTHGRLKRAVRVRRDKRPEMVGATENLQVRMYKGRSRLDPNGAWFWHFVNFGTEKQAAQPFFTNGFDANQPVLVNTFENGLDKRLKTAVKKAAKNGFELQYG